MSASASRLKRFKHWIPLFVFSFIAVVSWAFPFLLFFWSLPKCDLETLSRLTDLSGVDFEMRSEECFLSSSVSILAAKTGTNVKVILFEFSPILIDDNGRYVAPSVSVDGNDIYFHIERIAQIFSKQDNWYGYKIHYQIDYIPDLSQYGVDKSKHNIDK